MRKTREKKIMVSAIVLLAAMTMTDSRNIVNATQLESDAVPKVTSVVSTLESTEEVKLTKIVESTENQPEKKPEGVEQHISTMHEMMLEEMRENERKAAEEAERLRLEAEAEARQNVINTDYNVQLLARLIHAEAGICDDHEKYMVGTVVLNRVDSPNFPDTMSEVIYQKGHFTSVEGEVWKNEVATSREQEIAYQLLFEGHRECPSNVVYFSRRCKLGTDYEKTAWHEYDAE